MAIKRPETKQQDIIGLVEQSKGEKQSGVYLIGIESTPQLDYHLYPNDTEADPIHVNRVMINGQYVGVSDRMEVECRDYEVVDTSREESAKDFYQWTLSITMGPEDSDD